MTCFKVKISLFIPKSTKTEETLFTVVATNREGCDADCVFFSVNLWIQLWGSARLLGIYGWKLGLCPALHIKLQSGNHNTELQSGVTERRVAFYCTLWTLHSTFEFSIVTFFNFYFLVFKNRNKKKGSLWMLPKYVQQGRQRVHNSKNKLFENIFLTLRSKAI